MIPHAPTSNPIQRAPFEPLYDVNPQTGASIEVFYADRTLETFGKGGAGWFWWPRQRGFAQAVRRPVRLPRATQRIATQWIPTPMSRDAHDRAARSGLYEHDIQRRDQIALRPARLGQITAAGDES